MTMMFAFAAALLLQASAPAQAPGRLRWVPNPTTTTRGWVSDPAHHLRPATVAAIDSVCFDLERTTTAEAVVVIIDSLDGLEPADAALLLHRRWGVGKRDKNNGLLFLWSPALRKLQVSVGYHLEGVLPDARVGRILDEVVVPRFRRNAFDEGMIAGAKALADAAREETAWNASTGVPAYHPELTPEVAEAPEGAPVVAPQPFRGGAASDGRRARFPWEWFAMAGTLLLGLVSLVFARRYRAPRCPNGHGAMTRLDEQADDARLAPEQRIEEQLGSVDYDVWACARCDAVVVKPWNKWFSGYGPCPRCGRRASRSASSTLIPATQLSEGLVEVTTSCANCGARDVRRHATPRLPVPTSSSSGGSSSGFGGGSSGGGGGGSSFGGGSAGGGGAGRSY